MECTLPLFAYGNAMQFTALGLHFASISTHACREHVLIVTHMISNTIYGEHTIISTLSFVAPAEAISSAIDGESTTVMLGVGGSPNSRVMVV